MSSSSFAVSTAAVATLFCSAALAQNTSYMVGQRIASYEEMGIHSLLKKYRANALDPAALVNDIYDRIELNDKNDKNPILISRVSRADAMTRVAALKALRAKAGTGFDKKYPLWGIPFIVKDLVDVKGMVTTNGSHNWASFPNCPPYASPVPADGPIPDSAAHKDPQLLRFDAAGPAVPSIPFIGDPAAPACHPPPIANAPLAAPVADGTALIVQLALDAGAVLIGKANLDQFATGLVGTRSSYGPVRNVRNKNFITGGSSSGSAAAVAIGWASFAYGTDTAGSGRVPAGFNHLVGYKPTPGLLSNHRTFPAVRSVDSNTILTLNAEDSRYVAEIIKKFDERDPYSKPQADSLHCSANKSPPAKFRFGVPREIWTPDTSKFMDSRLASLWEKDSGARALYLEAVERLRRIGGEMVLFEYRPWEDVARLLYGGASVSQRFITYGNYVLANRPTGAPILVNEPNSADTDQLIDPTTYMIIRNAMFNKATRAYADEWGINLIRQQVVRKDWQRFDVMLLPTTPTIYRMSEVRAGYEIDLGPSPTNAQLVQKAAANTTLNSNLGTYTNFANLLQTTALALPAGFRTRNGESDVMPFGVTLFANTLNDCNLFPIAGRYERQLKADIKP